MKSLKWNLLGSILYQLCLAGSIPFLFINCTFIHPLIQYPPLCCSYHNIDTAVYPNLWEIELLLIANQGGHRQLTEATFLFGGWIDFNSLRLSDHICVSKLTIIGSDNDLSAGRRQVIIWTIAGILLIQTLGTNFSEILSKTHTFSFMKMHLKMSHVKWQPLCLGLNVLYIHRVPPV